MALKRKRSTRRRPVPSFKQIRDVEDMLRKDFHAAAARQKRCASCGASDRFQAHHVIYRQHLRARGLSEWDPRNALRVCHEVCPARCHARHHNATARINLTALTDDNVAYAFEVLGAGAYDYLRRYYDGKDPRLERALAEAA